MRMVEWFFIIFRVENHLWHCNSKCISLKASIRDRPHRIIEMKVDSTKSIVNSWNLYDKINLLLSFFFFFGWCLFFGCFCFWRFRCIYCFLLCIIQLSEPPCKLRFILDFRKNDFHCKMPPHKWCPHLFQYHIPLILGFFWFHWLIFVFFF